MAVLINSSDFEKTGFDIIRPMIFRRTKKSDKRNNLIRILIGSALILLIPLVAMQFSDEVDWGIFDFIIIGALLISTGFTYEILETNLKTPTQRAVLAILLLAALLLIWAEIAVGIIGTPFAGS
jgi:Kef-type K+ transport system membrane component KefB